MARFAFVGPSYPSQSPNVDAQRCINFYPEQVESGDGKSAYALYRTPGTKLFANLPGTSVPTMIFAEGRLFAVSGTSFCEISSAGVVTDWSASSGVPMVDDGTKPYLASDGLQLMIVSGGAAFSFILATNKLAPILIDSTSPTAIQGPVSQCGYSDGYFFALLRNSSKFQISGLLDDTSWSALDVAEISVFPDNIVGMLIDHREPWFWGPKQSQVYYNTGNLNFPYSPIPGAFIENGLGAPDSPVKLDNAVFWLDADERGSPIARRGQGYLPARVSNHAVEAIWQRFSKASDAITYSYQENGHTFLVIYFPTANQTWVYDVATGMWHERQWYDGGAHHSMCHVYAFGMHLVGDWSSGTIYQMSTQFLSDQDSAGKQLPIVRKRRAPFIAIEQQWIFHNYLQLDVEVGLGPMPPLYDGQGKPRDPQVTLRWSDNGTHSWSNDYVQGVGQAGHGTQRVIWRRLGRSRERIYEVQMSDAIDWSITDAYLGAQPDFGPKKRLVSQLAEQA